LREDWLTHNLTVVVRSQALSSVRRLRTLADSDMLLELIFQSVNLLLKRIDQVSLFSSSLTFLHH
jgi:hypothetical protein